eukprot:scaffold122_cov387-Prasinococcus_capsulatus_cf.AAC.5
MESMNKQMALYAGGTAELKGIWSVDANGKGHSLVETPDDSITKHIPERDKLGLGFPRGGFWPKCAVVGNSDTSLYFRNGREIDQYHAVFRMNNGPTKHYEDLVGHFTTVRVVEDKFHQQSREQASQTLVLQIISTRETLTNYINFKESAKGHNMEILSPDFILHLAQYMKRFPPLGFVTVALAWQKCKQVDVYGFGQVGQEPEVYWEVKAPTFGVAKQHSNASVTDAAMETALIESLQSFSGGTVRIMDPCTTFKEQYGHCLNCSGNPLAPGGRCNSSSSIPAAQEGYCVESGQMWHLPYGNCFRQCPPEERHRCEGSSRVNLCKVLVRLRARVGYPPTCTNLELPNRDQELNRKLDDEQHPAKGDCVPAKRYGKD